MLGEEFSIHPHARELMRALEPEPDFLPCEVGRDGHLAHVGHRLVLFDRMALTKNIPRNRHGFPALWLGGFLPKILRRGNLEMPSAIQRHIGIRHPIELPERGGIGSEGEKRKLKKEQEFSHGVLEKYHNVR